MSGSRLAFWIALTLTSFLLAFTAPPGVMLWPPIVALLVILVTRHALIGLLVGGGAGALLLAGGNPILAGRDLVAVHFLPSLQSPWKLGAIVFTFLLGGFASVLEAGGGFRTLLLRLTGRGGDQARRTEAAATGLGLLCFFDGLANSMVVGRVGRDLADRAGVARVKLAYIADSTSSAVACVAIISTWIAFQLTMIQEAYALAGLAANPYAVYLQSLPYNFYCWFTLVMLFVSIRGRFHPGPMQGFVQAASLREPEAATDSPSGSIASALVPLAVLMCSFFAFFLVLGSEGSVLPLERAKLVAAFGSDAGPQVLMLAATTASVAAVLLFPGLALGQAGKAFVRGLRTMIAPIFILLAAWILGSVIGRLGTAEWIAQWAAAAHSVTWLPTLIFLTGAIISFATGTSWGTMGLLFPLAVPLAAKLGISPEALPVIVAAVFSGAVFGDHCSPFSDTTIVTSISCGVEPHDHVRTQIPYALITAVVAIVAGFLPAGAGGSPYLSWAAGLGLLVLLPILHRRLQREKA